jgi:hypothetical protein
VPKFVFSEIQKRLAVAKEAAKVAAKFKLAGGMTLVMDKYFGIYKVALAGYVGSNPTEQDKWLMRFVIIPAIDKKYNQEAIDKLKIIVDKDKPNAKDVAYIKSEVVPYFDVNCKRLTGRALTIIGFPPNEELQIFRDKMEKQIARGKKVDAELGKDIIGDMVGANKIK